VKLKYFSSFKNNSLSFSNGKESLAKDLDFNHRKESYAKITVSDYEQNVHRLTTDCGKNKSYYYEIKAEK
jgi:hypothetical protein